jgi:hypothetical protein
MIKGAFHNVLDYGAVGNGTTSDYAAFNLALAQGGTVFVPSGIYKLDGKVTLGVDGTTLFLDANVTLNVSNVPAVQSPFGDHIYITGKNCSVIGSGASSLIQATGGTYSNLMGFRGTDYGSGLIANLAIDGAKDSTTALVDDSFGAGIMIIGGASPNKVQVENCIIRNCSQYGIDNYNFTGATTVNNCTIHDIGVSAQAYSVGCGIINSGGINNFTATNNTIYNCKLDGISSNSGYDASNYIVSNNNCYSNGRSGILFTQQADHGGTSGKGIVGCTVTGNICVNNGGDGIIFTATLGYLSHITVTGNVCKGNATYGIRATCVDATQVVKNIAISGNVTDGNTLGGVIIGAQVVNWSSSGNINNGVSESNHGTFSPAIAGTTVAGTPTYNYPAAGAYTKIGNRVFYTIVLDWSAIAGGTGNLQITGLPYAASATYPQSPAFVAANSITVTGQVYAVPLGGTTNAAILFCNNGAIGSLPIDTAGAITVSGSYATDI